ncbi:hypothetical protein [Bradyrhizobium ivorense]|uniref:hypothetical protein n=1 Tax=Bradyrhizobium ivorense TaxID=2511166 RepID=UPI0010B8F95E|nr:hypothetical protein [Bradyrhizobium ivorense]VIO71302.1 hypothetical protein CI41S_29730 [Bradyrhizobium ivorense]
MNRRRFLQGLSGTTAYPFLLQAPLALLSGPARAVEPITIIVAAIGIIKAIADANRGDGGLGASISAINGKVELAIHQLAVIQKTLEFMITQVAQLREDLFNALGEQYAYQLHNEVVASIGKIEDIRREAKLKAVDLAADNPARGDFPARLLAAYEIFDLARRKLWAYPQGVSTLCSTTCSSMAAIDSIAFAYGIASDARMAINLRRHLSWLDRMADPDTPYSVATALVEAHANEASIVERTKKDAQKLDAPSMIADKLYTASPAELCVVSHMDVQYFNEIHYKSWDRAGQTTSVLVATFLRDVTDRAGAKFLTNSRVQEYSVAHYKPDGSLFDMKSKPRAQQIDRAQCVVRDLPEYAIDPVHTKRNNTDTTNPATAWKTISPLVFDKARNSNPLWRSWTDPPNWKAAQLILDGINLERLKQEHAKTCLLHVTEHREFVRKISKQFPEVDDLKEVPK